MKFQRLGNIIYINRSQIGEGADPVTATANAVTQTAKLASQVLGVLVDVLGPTKKKSEIEAIAAENSVLEPLVFEFLSIFPKFNFEFFRMKNQGSPDFNSLKDTIRRKGLKRDAFDDHAWLNSNYRSILFNYKDLIAGFNEMKNGFVPRVQYPFMFTGYLPEVQAEIQKVKAEINRQTVQKKSGALNASATNSDTKKSNTGLIFGVGAIGLYYYFSNKKSKKKKR